MFMVMLMLYAQCEKVRGEGGAGAISVIGLLSATLQIYVLQSTQLLAVLENLAP